MNAHVWEFLRCSLGFDVVLVDNFGFGPWTRIGLANTPGYYPYEGTSLTTYTFGLRLTVALP